jgi:hypothetical protein
VHNAKISEELQTFAGDCVGAVAALCEGPAKATLSELKWDMTESIRDLGRRIDHVFHPDRD